MKCNIRSLDLGDYYGYLVHYDEVQAMKKVYSESVKELKLWGMCSLPTSVEKDFPKLEKLVFTLYDDAEDEYVSYILNLVKWIQETNIPEIRIHAVNMHVVCFGKFRK